MQADYGDHCCLYMHGQIVHVLTVFKATHMEFYMNDS